MQFEVRSGHTTLRHLGTLLLTLGGLALILSGAVRPAQAHGGGVLQLVNASAGPYLVSVWSEPDPPRAGELHLSVAVSAPPPGSAELAEVGAAELAEVGAAETEAGAVVLDAMVRVRAQSAGGAGEILSATASREEAANKFLYEADLELPHAGEWRVEVQVAGPAGAGEVGFDLHVLPAQTNPLAALSWPLWAGLGLVMAAGVWLVMGTRGGDK